MLDLSFGHDCMQVNGQCKYTIKQGEIRQKHVFLHPRFWIGILKHYVLRYFSSFKKKSRVFTGERVWPFSLICFKNRYNQRFWAPLKHQSGVPAFVFGGPRFCRTGGFSKKQSLFLSKRATKKA